MARTQHGLTLGTTDDGWDYSTCECGWMSPPCPGREEAWGFFNDHIEHEFAKVEGAHIDGSPGAL